MAALDFPAAPAVNDTHTQNGRTWVWTGESWAGSPPQVGTMVDPGTIGTQSWHSLFDPLAMTAAGSGSAVWPSANRALYLPFELWEAATVTQMSILNGTVVSGNMDVGIYDAAGSRLVSSGSIARANASDLQVVDLADTALDPGLYYMALAISTGSDNVFRWSGVATQWMRVSGIQQEDSALPLPATATMTNPAAAYIPRLTVGLRATL